MPAGYRGASGPPGHHRRPTGADIEDLGTDRGHRVLRVHRKGGKIQALALPAPGRRPD
jgi:hypothetical protein